LEVLPVARIRSEEERYCYQEATMAIHLVRYVDVAMFTLLTIYRYGTVYLLLQLVPPFSMFFLMTAPASSALWAADLEKVRREQEANLAQASQYTDEPDAAV
jgi:hypothetical protein